MRNEYLYEAPRYADAAATYFQAMLEEKSYVTRLLYWKPLFELPTNLTKINLQASGGNFDDVLYKLVEIYIFQYSEEYMFINSCYTLRNTRNSSRSPVGKATKCSLQ